MSLAGELREGDLVTIEHSTTGKFLQVSQDSAKLHLGNGFDDDDSYHFYFIKVRHLTYTYCFVIYNFVCSLDYCHVCVILVTFDALFGAVQMNSDYKTKTIA
jgi:hypothetical protein